MRIWFLCANSTAIDVQCDPNRQRCVRCARALQWHAYIDRNRKRYHLHGQIVCSMRTTPWPHYKVNRTSSAHRRCTTIRNDLAHLAVDFIRRWIHCVHVGVVNARTNEHIIVKAISRLCNRNRSRREKYVVLAFRRRRKINDSPYWLCVCVCVRRARFAHHRIQWSQSMSTALRCKFDFIHNELHPLKRRR